MKNNERVVEKNGERWYLRFPLADRITHWMNAIAFITLAITGLAQKFAISDISHAIISGLGGIENVRIIHRIAATILMVTVVYHLGDVLYKMFVRRSRPTMLPSLGDLRDAFHAFWYNLGLSKTYPQQGRYTFDEKAEYWSLVWGTVVMILSGFMLWNPLATTQFLPGEWIPAAKAAHGGEALLAVLAIILWHLYHVFIKHFNKSMYTGYLSEEEMLHTHPLELADIKAGIDTRPVTEKEAASRKRVFWPMYGITAVVMLASIYWFVSFEQTAVANRPPAETVTPFAPYTATPLPTLPPTATPEPTQPGAAAVASTWEGGIGLIFKQTCSACHGENTQLGSLNLGSYLSALAGGASGPGIVPGKPDESQIIIKQSAGGHPGQLTPGQIDLLRQWILNGAPEK